MLKSTENMQSWKNLDQLLAEFFIITVLAFSLIRRLLTAESWKNIFIPLNINFWSGDRGNKLVDLLPYPFNFITTWPEK